MLATGTDDFSTVADTSFIGRAALNSATNWQSILGGSNDDAGVCFFNLDIHLSMASSCRFISVYLYQWIVLALWKIADYKASRGKDNSAYLVSPLPPVAILAPTTSFRTALARSTTLSVVSGMISVGEEVSVCLSI
jgi:hypothetical protein